MKLQLSLIVAMLGIVLAINCGGGNVYSADQCEKTFDTLFEKIAGQANEEDKAKFAPMKATLMGKLKKDCMSGKFNLECLESADAITAMQTCLN